MTLLERCTLVDLAKDGDSGELCIWEFRECVWEEEMQPHGTGRCLYIGIAFRNDHLVDRLSRTINQYPAERQ